jgi:hypothetical protein
MRRGDPGRSVRQHWSHRLSYQMGPLSTSPRRSRPFRRCDQHHHEPHRPVRTARQGACRDCGRRRRAVHRRHSAPPAFRLRAPSAHSEPTARGSKRPERARSRERDWPSGGRRTEPEVTIYRATVIDTPRDPFHNGADALKVDADAGLVVRDGVMTARGPYLDTKAQHPDEWRSGHPQGIRCDVAQAPGRQHSGRRAGARRRPVGCSGQGLRPGIPRRHCPGLGQRR